MARGVNKAIILGNVGQDPEVRYNSNGKAMASLSIATSEQWKDKQTGERKEKSEWHRVVMFGRLGEIAGEYLRKGSQVYIEGKIATRKWQDKQGQDRYTTEIVANEMQMLGGKAGGQAEDDRGHSGSNQQNPANAPAQPAGGFDDFDDSGDIPF